MHPSKRRPVSASEHSSREVGQPGAGAQPEPELARSILVLAHQLALHRRPRDGWGSQIRIGSNSHERVAQKAGGHADRCACWAKNR